MTKAERRKRWAELLRQWEKLLSVYRQILMDEINEIAKKEAK